MPVVGSALISFSVTSEKYLLKTSQCMSVSGLFLVIFNSLWTMFQMAFDLFGLLSVYVLFDLI